MSAGSGSFGVLHLTTETEAVSRSAERLSLKSAIEMVSKIALIIFLVEACIMLVLEQMRPWIPPLVENFIDSLVLMTVASPIIYFVAVRPFVFMARDASERLEGQLVRAQSLLDANIKLQASLRKLQKLWLYLTTRSCRRSALICMTVRLSF